MLAAVFLWSSATPASKFVLLEVPPAEFVMLRLSLAAVALWLIVLALQPDVRLRKVGWRPLAMGILEPGLVLLRHKLRRERPVVFAPQHGQRDRIATRLAMSRRRKVEI